MKKLSYELSKKELAYIQNARNFIKREGLDNLTPEGDTDYDWNDRRCDVCRNTIGSRGYKATGYNPKTKDVQEYEICQDCALYFANDELPQGLEEEGCGCGCEDMGCSKFSIVADFIKTSQEMDTVFTDEDRGMYADSSLGRDNLRKTLIDLLVAGFEDTPYQQYAEEVVEALKEPAGNDWFDEKAALKMLNSVTENDLNWDIIDGDLMLLGEDDYEEVEEEVEVEENDEGLEEQSCLKSSKLASRLILEKPDVIEQEWGTRYNYNDYHIFVVHITDEKMRQKDKMPKGKEFAIVLDADSIRKDIRFASSLKEAENIIKTYLTKEQKGIEWRKAIESRNDSITHEGLEEQSCSKLSSIIANIKKLSFKSNK